MTVSRIRDDVRQRGGDSSRWAQLRLLEAIRTATCLSLLQAGSSEMFGSTPTAVRTVAVSSPNPYAISKVFAHWMTIQYRDA